MAPVAKPRSSLWVAVTGGNGFVGSHLVEQLVRKRANVKVVSRSEPKKNLGEMLDVVEHRRTDMLDRAEVGAALRDVEFVFHLASKVGGIQYNMAHPSEMFGPNVTMNLNLLDACANSKTVERVLVISSTCVYRRFCTIPAPEAEGFLDDPEPTNFGYGWAKRVAEKAASIYAKQYGMKIGIVRPENVYGPRDNFSPEYAHVIPALIRRALEATDRFTIWGSGRQTRSFLYVEDAAEAMMLALEEYPEPDPINIGSGREVSIADLATLMLKILRKESVRLFFDTSKPEGQPRKASDTTRMKSILGYSPRHTLEEGLNKTIGWVLENRRCLD